MTSSPAVVKPKYAFIEVHCYTDKGETIIVRQAFSFPFVDSELDMNREEHPAIDSVRWEDLVAKPPLVDLSLRIRNAHAADPPAEPKFKRRRCPVCGKETAVTKDGLVWAHNDRRGKSYGDSLEGFRCRGTHQKGLALP